MENKRFYLLSLLVILFITVCSCEDDREELPNTSGSITFPSTEDTRPVFPSKGGTTSLSFTAKENWAATTTNTRSNNWMTISPTSGGKGNAKITITVMPNDTNNERSAIITLNCEGNSEEIIVTQKPKDRSYIERSALIALYKATNGDSWTNNTNWCSDKPINEWYGISASATGVENILLSENGLEGTIPEEIGNLSELHILDLSRNNLEGEIPTSIGNLTKVTYLKLSDNRLSGNIPKEIGNMVSLVEFDIANYTFNAAGGTIVIDPETGEVTGGGTAQNSLSGPIPVELCQLPNLRELFMSGNKLSGEIPEEIWNMPSLTGLGLSQNLLTGSIPSSIRNAKKLKQLWLSNNLLTGTLPDEMCELSNLEEFIVHNTTHKIVAGWMVKNTEYNHITGTLPENIGNLKKLKQLCIGSVGLTGELPKSIWTCESMEVLTMPNAGEKYPNTFTGIIPEEIVNMKNLYDFDITGNKFTGTIPKGITKLTNLRGFIVDKNNIEGVIPEDIGKLIGLSYFEAEYNKLEGSIPKSICNLVKLQNFCISGNKIEGNIPEEIRTLKKLEAFWASNNNLVGNIPIGFAELPDLRGLIVRGNRLSGVVPREIVLLPMWEKHDIYKDILPQQEGYSLTIEYEKTQFRIQKLFTNKIIKNISKYYQMGNQMVFETEHERGNIAITKDRF